MAYYGEYTYTLDAANRIIVPTRFREQLGAEAVIYRSIDGCLFIYDTPEFQNIIAPLKTQARTAVGREKLRRFYSDVSAVSVDRNGRLVLPAECIAHAGLKDEVILLGADNRIEVWDKSLYLENIGNKDEISEADYPEVEF